MGLVAGVLAAISHRRLVLPEISRAGQKVSGVLNLLVVWIHSSETALQLPESDFNPVFPSELPDRFLRIFAKTIRSETFGFDWSPEAND